MPPAALYPETAQLPPLAGGAGYPVAPGDPHMRAMPTAGVLPGTPTPIPITPRPGFIAFGIVCMAMAMWSLFDFLPGVAPGAKASARLGELGEGLYYGANVAAVLLLIIGFVVTLGATIYRAQTEVLCRVCNHQVIGWKDPFGLRCPLEPHYARVSWLTLAITGTFWTVGVAALILLAVAIWT